MLISQLDPENKKKALAYRNSSDSDYLDIAFCWGNTQEGHHYWKQLHHAILAENNTPEHYKSLSGKDVINFCHDNNNLNFCRGSAIKYIVRAGKKEDEIDDLKKAIDFLQREIKNLEK